MSHLVPVSKTAKQLPPRPTIVSVGPGNEELFLNVSVAEPTSGPTVTSVTVTCGTQSATVAEVDAGQITVAGLTNGQKYRCKAYATNSRGKGPRSKPVKGTPSVVVPGVPSITSVSPGNGSFTVSYTAAPGYGSTITGYTATCGLVTTTVGGSTLTAEVSGLAPDGNYTCSLYATDVKGNGANVQ
jgi:titin